MNTQEFDIKVADLIDHAKAMEKAAPDRAEALPWRKRWQKLDEMFIYEECQTDRGSQRLMMPKF